MSVSSDSLRHSVGRTLREIRVERRLSLDDVEALTRQEGIRVTRSHLSRVETGNADIALPRFLCLMRALGEPPGRVANGFDALLGATGCEPKRIAAEARRALVSGDVRLAARLTRAGCFDGRARSEELLDLAVSAEFRIGSLSGAALALRRLLTTSSAPTHLSRFAVVSVALNEPFVARAIACAIDEDEQLGALITAAALLVAGRSRDAAELASRHTTADATTGVIRERSAIALAIAATGYRAQGQIRSARRTAERAIESSPPFPAIVELLILAACTDGDLRRPLHGLRRLDRARRLLKGRGYPALSAAVSRESSRLWKLAGDRGAARAAVRAERALIRRFGSERCISAPLPLYGLFSLCEARGQPRGAQADPERSSSASRSMTESTRESPAMP